MIKYIFFATILCLCFQEGMAQDNHLSKALQQNKAFAGAEAGAETYKAIYQLDTDDPKIIQKTIRNINNVLEDPRLKGNLQIELVTYAGGTQALLKENAQYKKPLEELIEKGVTVVQCENSVAEQGRTKDEFFDFVGFTPSGNGELIIRAAQGWVIIKP